MTFIAAVREEWWWVLGGPAHIKSSCGRIRANQPWDSGSPMEDFVLHPLGDSLGHFFDYHELGAGGSTAAKHPTMHRKVPMIKYKRQ
jgi:hypothetical protein